MWGGGLVSVCAVARPSWLPYLLHTHSLSSFCDSPLFIAPHLSSPHLYPVLSCPFVFSFSIYSVRPSSPILSCLYIIASAIDIDSSPSLPVAISILHTYTPPIRLPLARPLYLSIRSFTIHYLYSTADPPCASSALLAS